MLILILLAVDGAFASEIPAMPTTQPATLIHISINRPMMDVYAFVADPTTWSQWAAGLSRSPLLQEGEFWIAESPMGRVKITFPTRNEFGVLDHEVTLPDGTVVTNPLRVQANGDGAEVIFTLYRREGVSDDALAEDAGRVRADLQKLKEILERERK